MSSHARNVVAILFTLAAAVAAQETRPSISYGGSRESKAWIDTPQGRVAVDDGVAWQGVKVYLSLMWDLIATDEATGKLLWSTSVGAFWNEIGFKELETAGAKIQVVELRPGPRARTGRELRQYHDLKTGRIIPGPADVPSGKVLEIPRHWSGRWCASPKAVRRLVGSADDWKASVLEPMFGDGKEVPDFGPIDFEKNVVLVIAMGEIANCDGIDATAWEDDRRILVRLAERWFQTAGPDGGAQTVRPWGIVVLPRRDPFKVVIVERNRQRMIQGPEVWKEAYRFAALGDAGEGVPRAQDPAPATRPANGVIAFTRAGNAWLIDADGRNERKVTQNLAYDRPLAWTSDGRRLVYWKQPEDWHLWSVDVDSGMHKDLTPDGGDCRSGTASPDSKLIAFMSGRDGFSVMNADGSNRRVLSKLGHRDAPPAWSPDGARLAFTHLYSVGEQHVDLDVYLVGKEGGEPVAFVKSAEQPVWSRDGRTLYCLAKRKSRSDLFAIDVATRAETNLTTTPDLNEHALALSPDGRRIALVTWDADWKTPELRLLDIDGARQKTLLTLEGRPSIPSWSPDSKHLAITSGMEPKPKLLVIDADSGKSTQLTVEGASWAVWRPR